MEKLLYTPNNCNDCLNLWMAYPACESFGLSSLGYMWLSKLAEESDFVNSERVYTDSKVTRFNYCYIRYYSYYRSCSCIANLSFNCIKNGRSNAFINNCYICDCTDC